MVFSCPLPSDALLARYADPAARAHTDCYALDVPGTVSLEGFVAAFYSSRAFRPERVMLGLLFGKRAVDADAWQLARDETRIFSAWRVEDRTADQLLMYETLSGKTRSWFRVGTRDGGTRLYFGSAVLPVGKKPDGSPRMSVLYALLGFHKIYARILLHSAGARLQRG